MKFNNDFLVICGQHFSRHGKMIRGPFKTIAKLARNGWSDRAKILSHITSCGQVWHEVEFKTAKEAKEAAKAAKPKQAMTGKRLWAAAGMRKDVTEALKADLAEGEKVGIGDVNKELTAQWKALTESERADWDARAAAGEVPSSGDDSE